MDMSIHAKIRSQQRAIPPMMIDLLLKFGTSEKSGNGTSKFFFDKASRRKVKAYAGNVSKVLEEHLDLYVVVGENNAVVTVAHRMERIQRN